MALSIPIREPGWIGEFKAFIARGSVIDLAVGIVIGAAFTGVVNSLVRDVINPIIGLAAGGIDFSNVFFALNGQHYNTLAAARAAGAATVNLGLFINAIINFVIVSFAIFWVIKALTRMHLRADPTPAGPARSEVLLEEIRDELRARPVAAEPAR